MPLKRTATYWEESPSVAESYYYFYALASKVASIKEGGGVLMPIYDYHCKKCNKDFSVTMSMAEHEKKKVACPTCKGKRVTQLVSLFTAQTSKKS